ncbi:hypothetical protein [Pseudokineococcus sp. 1T1Z-3]|uniref:hypothetical protein n=1 Tax=Pseudokineococcus sp. 1T1Z-3 TaxID=3132745 RepID=UPI0030AE3A5E
MTMTTNKDAEALWSEDEKLTAMRAVIAHALLRVLTTTAPGHGAAGVLRQWITDADHLLSA